MQAAKAAQAKAAALGSVTSNAQLLAEQSKVNISLAQKRIDTLSQTDAALRRSVHAYKQAEDAGRRLTAASKEEQIAKQELLDLGQKGRQAEIEEAKALQIANVQSRGLAINGNRRRLE